ncbi:flagellar protein FlgN [Abyssisolibacter fermentans]|uniref:flagellar protein FlgN n=1 Tax=Abyssisolibacter fermentans TaxID=1766203 RepID=UPI000837653B|nr:flagellar protein FlgN [Abyssisolibacter fermentans]
MQALLSELKKILNQEYAVYEELLKLTENKTQVIIEGKIKELDEITKLEENQILKIANLEQIREDIAMKLRNSLGLSIDSNITNIIDKLSKQDKEDLEVIKRKIVSVLDKIKEKNDLNNTLIGDALEYINLNINLLTNTKQGNVYNKKDNNFVQQNKSLFDVKA